MVIFNKFEYFFYDIDSDSNENAQSRSLKNFKVSESCVRYHDNINTLRNPMVAEAKVTVFPEQTLHQFLSPMYICKMYKHSDGRWDISVTQFLPANILLAIIILLVMSTVFALFSPYLMHNQSILIAYTKSTLMSMILIVFMLIYVRWARLECGKSMSESFAREVCVYTQKNLMQSQASQ